MVVASRVSEINQSHPLFCYMTLYRLLAYLITPSVFYLSINYLFDLFVYLFVVFLEYESYSIPRYYIKALNLK